MKKVVTIVLIIIAAGAAGAYFYWQYNKNKIVKDSIGSAIAKKTDSLYYLHYDSSYIDELNGNASFYNVVLQSDSAQKQLLNSTDSLPNALYNIKIKQVTANGVDIPGLLAKRNVAATSIVLLRPVIQIINTGADHPKPYTINDSLELYKKILGKFESIKADTIQIVNGTVLITNKIGNAQTSLENINVTLNKFLVDNTRDYKNLISYFIKDVRATVENIQLPSSKNDTRINLEKVDYNATKKYLAIGAIRQYKANNINAITDLKNIVVNELNTDAFIIQQRLKAGQITCDGGVITIYVKKKSAGKAVAAQEQSLELSTDLIDQAQIGGINLGSTKVIVVEKDNPGKPPFVLNNAKFRLTKMLKIEEGATINNIINNAEWELAANGFNFNTSDVQYKVSVGDFNINTTTSQVTTKNFLLTPLLTEQEFVSHSKFQKDLYNVAINNISLSGVNIKKLLTSKELEVENASFQPSIKIFNDRTLPSDEKNKTGNYPHQSILKLGIPLYIHKATLSNGTVSYRERAIKSKLVGNVFFSGINATINNITNMPSRIKNNPLMKLNATAKFLNEGNITTEWQFPLNAGNGAFTISGHMSGMNAVTLNPIIEPLAMASVKEGQVDEVKFSINGTDTKAIGNVLFLYHNLKMEILKKGDDASLKKKGFVSFLANTFIKNENTNPANSKQVNYVRDATRSFFNLVWKTIFTGAKNTAIGPRAKEEK